MHFHSIHLNLKQELWIVWGLPRATLDGNIMLLNKIYKTKVFMVHPIHVQTLYI